MQAPTNDYVVIPIFNEDAILLKKIINSIKQILPKINIIVIDDGSSYNIENDAILKNVLYIKHEVNLGKGAALKTGAEAAIKLGAQKIIFMDGDGQHKPEDLPRFLNELNKDNDLVFGSRIIGKEMPLIKFLGNKFLTIMINLLFNIYISDTQSGYRAFQTNIYNKIKWESANYNIETEMIAKVAKNKIKFTEIIIDTIYLDSYKGTSIFDGIIILFNLLKWKYLC